MSDAALASWAFGAVSLVYLASIATYLVVRKSTNALPPIANFILGFFCAVAGGFCTYFFSGKLGLTFQVPGTNINGDAAGGIAVFVFVLLLWHRYALNGVSNVTVNIEAMPAKTLEAFDRVLTNLEHVWSGVRELERGERPTPRVRHVRLGTGDSEEIRFTEVGETQPLQVLTVEEVRQKLSDDEMRLLLDTEAAMREKAIRLRPTWTPRKGYCALLAEWRTI